MKIHAYSRKFGYSCCLDNASSPKSYFYSGLQAQLLFLLIFMKTITGSQTNQNNRELKRLIKARVLYTFVLSVTVLCVIRGLNPVLNF